MKKTLFLFIFVCYFGVGNNTLARERHMPKKSNIKTFQSLKKRMAKKNKLPSCTVGAEYFYLDSQGWSHSILLTATAQTCGQAGSLIDVYVTLWALSGVNLNAVR